MVCNPYLREKSIEHPGITGNAILSLVIQFVILCHVAYDPALFLNELRK